MISNDYERPTQTPHWIFGLLLAAEADIMDIKKGIHKLYLLCSTVRNALRERKHTFSFRMLITMQSSCLVRTHFLSRLHGRRTNSEELVGNN